MARIAGVNLPREKRVEIGLTYIFGIGRSTSQSVLGSLEIDRDTKVRDLTEEEVLEAPRVHRLRTSWSRATCVANALRTSSA